jgi:glycosyltransferase involved in cell wall biosynthesis
MKVALITGNLSRKGAGVSAVVEELSRALLDEGLEVEVFGLSDRDWIQGGSQSWRGAPATAFPVIGPASFGYAPQMLQRLYDWSPDVVHVHGLWMYPSRAVLQWSLRTRRPYMISPHGMLRPWALKTSAWKKKLAGYLYENQHLQSATCFHALSRAEAEAISAYAPSHPIFINTNGVARQPELEKPLAPWQGQLQDNKFVLLFLGRLHPVKNLERLLEAWSDAHHENGAIQDWHLVIAGWDKDNHGARLRELADTLAITGSVSFTGPLFGVEKEAAFRNARAFVLPSLGEALPVAILEAWSFGVPVLMTDECSLPEGFSAKAAYRLGLTRPEMTHDLKAFVATDPSLLDQMGFRARTLAQQVFSWRNVAIRFVGQYKILASGEHQEPGIR